MHTYLVTCEHGGNEIPLQYRDLFVDQQPVLDTHRGYDPGALIFAQQLARALSAELVTSTTTRLLVDLNRSVGHPQLFSEFTRSLPNAVRTKILAEHHTPYRTQVESFVSAEVARGEQVVHLSSHSFVPVLNGIARRADIGLLYDPQRSSEAHLCKAWRQILSEQAPHLRVRRNYPYRGTGDGLTTHLRRRFLDPSYLGIELEVNHATFVAGGVPWRNLCSLLVATFQTALDRCAFSQGNFP